MTKFSDEASGAPAPFDLRGLSDELAYSFFAERVALSAGLNERIHADLPRSATSMAVRAFRLLGALEVMATTTVLLLLHQLYALRGGGMWEAARMAWVGVWLGLGMLSCVGAWFSAWLGGALWLWGRSRGMGWLGGRFSPVVGAAWIRAISLALMVLSSSGLFSEWWLSG